MNDNKIFMKNIEELGRRYQKEYLESNFHKQDLEENWWEALKFFFGRSFMRGRNDKLSKEYMDFTVDWLRNYFSISNDDLDCSYHRLQDEKKYFEKEYIMKKKEDNNMKRRNIFKNDEVKKEICKKNPIVKKLATKKEIEVNYDGDEYQKTIHLANDEDVMMVLDVLKYISERRRKNVYIYLRDRIKNEGIGDIYIELKKLRGIADKIATFILRDIALLDGIDISYNEGVKVFPVDTLVRKIPKLLDENIDDDKDIKGYFIDLCEKHDVNQLLVAAGLWYMVRKSSDILVKDYLNELPLY